MSEDTVQITVRDFIENIRKNGLPKATGVFFTFDTGHEGNIPFEGKIKSACAFGQGLINSGAIYAVDKPNFCTLESLMFSSIYGLNDNFDRDLTLSEIANMLLVRHETKLDLLLTFEKFDYTPFL